MTTLRRNLRTNFEKILQSWNTGDEETLAEELSDAALQVFREENKPKVDLKNSDPAWSILAGETVDTESSILANEARNAFERDMKFGTLPWSSTKKWENLEKLVITQYTQDQLIFTKYKTWQLNEGKYVALSNKKIREDPQAFVDCFPDFLAHSVMYGQKKSTGTPDLDANGVVVSY